MFHAAMVPIGHTTPFKDGSTNYVMRRFDVEIFLRSIQSFRLTELTVVPPIVLTILSSPLTKDYDLTSVQSVLCGAAALDKTNQRKFEELIAPDGCFNQVWGVSTETSTDCNAMLTHFSTNR
jgi:4-coumarate--CoA ligase